MENIDREFLAWLAGFWEGEGHFRIRNSTNPRRFNAEFAVSNTKSKPVRLIHEKLGVGYVTVEKTKNPNWNPKYRWTVSRKQDLLMVVNLILPFLNFRKSEVEEKSNLLKGNEKRHLQCCHYSVEDEEFVRSNFSKMSDGQMAIALKRTYHGLRTFRKKIGLIRGRFPNHGKEFRGVRTPWNKSRGLSQRASERRGEKAGVENLRLGE